MVKIVYDGVPPGIKKEIQAELKALQWLIPSWCQYLYINWNPTGSNDGTLIFCNTMYEYRNVRLTFCPLFLEETDRRREHVIHDLLHGFAAPLADYAYDTIDRLVTADEAPKFRDSLLEELRVRNESFVQDLAHCLAAKLT
jgi:hypothetical protein